MASEAQHGTERVHVVALLAAGVIAVPIFKRLASARCSAISPSDWL